MMICAILWWWSANEGDPEATRQYHSFFHNQIYRPLYLCLSSHCLLSCGKWPIIVNFYWRVPSTPLPLLLPSNWTAVCLLSKKQKKRSSFWSIISSILTFLRTSFCFIYLCLTDFLKIIFKGTIPGSCSNWLCLTDKNEFAIPVLVPSCNPLRFFSLFKCLF